MELSSPGWQSIYELATPNKNLHTWICLFQLCKVCIGSLGGRNHYYDSTAQMAMQQHVVEHGEHDKAQKKSWSSAVSGLSSRCPVLPLDPARSGWESEVDCAPLSHYNPIHSACRLNQQHTFTASTYMQIIQKPFGDGRAAKQQVRKHWKLKLRTCTQAWFYMITFLKSEAVWGIRQPNWATEQTFLGSFCSPT